MKKIITFMLLIITLITTSSKAQESSGDTRTELYLGMKAGFNYANVYDTEGEKFQADGKLGFAGGLFMTIPIGKFIGIQPELLFSQKGFKGTGVMLGTPYSLTRTSNYIDVPLLFALKPGRGISLLAGPQFSYLLRQRDEFTNGVTSEEQIREFENDNIRRNTLCFLGGIDFNFSPFVLGTRLGWDIQNNHGDGSSSTPRYKNTWFQTTLGVRF
jgi:hypothetical protein